MLAAIPLTPEKMNASNKKFLTLIMRWAPFIKMDLKNLPRAIETFEKLAARFPDNENIPQVDYSLFLLYQEVGNTAKADCYERKDRSELSSQSFRACIIRS
jgi:hypothetical protein